MIKSSFEYDVLFKNSKDNFQKIITPFSHEFKWFIGRVYNIAFESVDLELYYSMIRKNRPDLIIEIGSGHSTHFALDALKKNKSGHIICIDPVPRRNLPDEIEHIKTKVEDVEVSLFGKLNENDILFIDSSHTTEEAEYHCNKILPNLKKGVFIHHHDFTYPYSIYCYDDPIKYGEPDVLLKFYMKNQHVFEIITSDSYVRYKDPDLINRLIKSYKWDKARIPGSLWARKIA